jgi:hypothetical protein
VSPFELEPAVRGWIDGVAVALVYQFSKKKLIFTQEKKADFFEN